MRVAVGQAPGVKLADWRGSLQLLDDLIARAHAARAELLVLPECVWPAYCIGSREAYWAARDDGLPGPEFLLQHVSKAARGAHLAVCVGFIAERNRQLLNAAAFVSSGGDVVGERYKNFLWAFDRHYFEPADEIAPFDTEFGRVGVLICADLRLPEITATLVARGARLIVQPTAWVNVGTPEAPWNPQPEFLVSARAEEFGVPVASASKWGRELDTPFVGSSVICDAAGGVLARCGPTSTELAVADIELGQSRPPQVTAVERSALLGDTPPEQPPQDVPNLQLVLAHNDENAAAMGEAPRLVLTRTSARADFQQRVHCTSTTDHATLKVSDIQIDVFAGDEANRFAPLRAAALRGTHVALCFGDDADDTQARARALENRIYVILHRSQGVTVIAPSGSVITALHWPSTPTPAHTVSLECSVAAQKEVAWQTHMLADRRPRHYEF